MACPWPAVPDEGFAGVSSCIETQRPSLRHPAEEAVGDDESTGRSGQRGGHGGKGHRPVSPAVPDRRCDQAHDAGGREQRWPAPEQGPRACTGRRAAALPAGGRQGHRDGWDCGRDQLVRVGPRSPIGPGARPSRVVRRAPADPRVSAPARCCAARCRSGRGPCGRSPRPAPATRPRRPGSDAWRRAPRRRRSAPCRPNGR